MSYNVINVMSLHTINNSNYFYFFVKLQKNTHMLELVAKFFWPRISLFVIVEK